MLYRFLLILLLVPAVSPTVSATVSPAVSAEREPLILSEFSPGMLGDRAVYFQELEGQQLTLQEARARFAGSDIKQGSSGSVTLGLGVEPAWLRVLVDNERSSDRQYRLSIETPWLDYIDAYMVHDGEVIRNVRGGDGLAFDQRPMQIRHFAFETVFPSGTTELIFRVQTEGPMAIPIRLATVEQASRRDITQAYQYGALYGIMLALGIYNLILFFMIRKPEFGLYSAYLFGFVANSLSYTGQIHTVITPDFGPLFQDWVDISLMITYSVLGLHFARHVLRTWDYAPRLDRFTYWVANGIPVGMLLGALMGSLQISMLLAFLLNTGFVVLFVVLGYRALQAKVEMAWFFFVSSVTAATCIGISTGAVAGLLPYNDVTFKLIEAGMAFEAVMLAVLLAHHFKAEQRSRAEAEFFARTDDLTGINNRRGFREQANVLWENAIRYNNDLSIVLCDIDKFKRINDHYGHDAGDAVIQEMARRLAATARGADVYARWGGEEFILLLPNTDHEQARFQAERMRRNVEADPVQIDYFTIPVTISLGVAGSSNGRIGEQTLAESKLEKLIGKSDEALYKAKQSGRNQVKVYHFELQNLA